MSVYINKNYTVCSFLFSFFTMRDAGLGFSRANYKQLITLRLGLD